MPRELHDIPTGLKKGRLTFLKITEHTWKNFRQVRYGLFQCDCGKLKEIQVNNVLQGHTKSCGCLYKEVDRTYMKEVNKKKIGTKYNKTNELL